MADTLTADDPRYRAMFDVANEAASHGDGHVHGDLTPLMSQLRERAPVLKGSLRELLDLPPMPHDYSAHRQQYTLFSYKICESAFRDNQTFSSEIYRAPSAKRRAGKKCVSTCKTLW